MQKTSTFKPRLKSKSTKIVQKMGDLRVLSNLEKVDNESAYEASWPIRPSSETSLFTIHNGVWRGQYEQISDELQGYLSELLDSHTLGIGISWPCEQISDELKGYFSELLDSHTLGI